MAKARLKSAIVDHCSFSGCQLVCTSTGSNPLLLNNLINSASPTKEPPLHSEVFQELDSLLPLRMTIAFSNSSNEIHVHLIINPKATKSQESGISESTRSTISKLNFNNNSKSSQLVDLIHQKRQKTAAAELELKARRTKQRKDNRSKAKQLSEMHGQITAGNLVKNNTYHLGKDVMDLVRKQQQDKINKQAHAIPAKYRTNLKLYQDGIALRNSKKVGDWTSSDFHTMIKFKQLFKDNMPPLPTTLQSRKLRWFQVCKSMADPPCPTKPDAYIDAVSKPTLQTVDARGGRDDEMSVASIDMFPV